MADTFPFSRNMQARADAKAHEYRTSVFGAKCWYGDAIFIEHGADLAFVGVNPGGGPEDQQHDLAAGFLERPYAIRGYSAWLDGPWSGNGPAHQAAVHRVYRVLFGSSWEAQLRRSASFNVSPFRTTSEADLPKVLKLESVDWFFTVLNRVSPQLVICEGKLPWDALLSHGARLVREEHAYNVAWVREATMQSEGLELRIIGLPHLSRFRGDRVFEVLAGFAP